MIRRETMIKALKNDAIANPSHYDDDFLDIVDGLSDAWVKASHTDIGAVYVPFYIDNTLDLNKAFA